MSLKAAFCSAIVVICVLGIVGSASAQMPNPYGPSISLETAKKVAVPALAEAAKNNWTIAVAIVDPGGNLVYYEKMDNTQLGSAHIAVDKASTAAMFLKEFAEDTPWIHLDIAGTAWMEDNKPWIAKGPSGIAVRSLIEFAREFGN